MRCDQCKFFESRDSTCHKAVPIARPPMNPQHPFGWQRVPGGEWCGAWEAKGAGRPIAPP